VHSKGTAQQRMAAQRRGSVKQGTAMAGQRSAKAERGIVWYGSATAV